MSYDFEKKTTNTGKDQNFFRKMGEESLEASLTIFFSQSFIYDPLDVFTKGRCSNQY